MYIYMCKYTAVCVQCTTSCMTFGRLDMYSSSYVCTCKPLASYGELLSIL